MGSVDQGPRGEGIVKHHETMKPCPCVGIYVVLPHSPSTLGFGQRLVSYAWMPMTKKTWSITFSEGSVQSWTILIHHWNVRMDAGLVPQGCAKPWQSIFSTKKSGNPSETLFWKCIVEKSHLQVLFQDVVQQLTPKKNCKESPPTQNIYGSPSWNLLCQNQFV